MSEPIPISSITFLPAAASDVADGLLAYVTFEVGGLRIDGVTLRRTRAGRFALSFPERRDSQGRRHSIVRPLDGEARREIEAQVLAAIKSEEATSWQ